MSGCSTVLRMIQLMEYTKSMFPTTGGPPSCSNSLYWFPASCAPCSKEKAWCLCKLRGEFRDKCWSLALLPAGFWAVHFQDCHSFPMRLVFITLSKIFRNVFLTLKFLLNCFCYLYPVNLFTCILSLKISREEQTLIYFFYL